MNVQSKSRFPCTAYEQAKANATIIIIIFVLNYNNIVQESGQ